MRWAIIRHDGKVRACIPETVAIFVSVVDPRQPLVKIPACMPLVGMPLPLSGEPGVSLTWEDEPVPLEGQPPFGTESGKIATGAELHIFGQGGN